MAACDTYLQLFTSSPARVIEAGVKECRLRTAPCEARLKSGICLESPGRVPIEFSRVEDRRTSAPMSLSLRGRLLKPLLAHDLDMSRKSRTIAYGAFGRTRTATDAAGRVLDYDHTPAGDLWKLRSPESPSESEDAANWKNTSTGWRTRSKKPP